jgi:hypothetical protein
MLELVKSLFGGWGCILVFSFGPNQAFGSELGLAPSQTTICKIKHSLYSDKSTEKPMCTSFEIRELT